ncbi:MAG: hypothetical protein CMM01_24580 [Rhodopirellula sp.]|nr:hypothetical protein [Rhodopirellula sp.]
MLTEDSPACETRFLSRRIRKMLSVEWMGQSIASLCWMCSVFAYGIQSAGDWLQLCAACAWLVANVGTVLAVKVE